MHAQDSSVSRRSEAPFCTIRLYCLVPLSDNDKNAYRTAFTENEESSDYKLEFVDLVNEAKNSSPDNSVDAMYRYWRSHGDQAGTHRHFMFFVDEQAMLRTGAVLLQQDIYTLCHREGSTQWAQDMMGAELRQRLEAHLSANQARQQQAGHFTSVSPERYAAMWVGEVLAPLYYSHGHLLSQRGVTYGRIPASGVPSAWGNLDISNMSMSELVEYLGRKDEVPDEGVVYEHLNRDWDEASFAEAWKDEVERCVSRDNVAGTFVSVNDTIT